MRTLHDVQETTLSYQPVEIADRVASEFLVVEIQPEPNLRTAIVDVEGARLGVLGNDKEHEQGLRELDPSFDLGLLSHIQQSLHRSIRASANLVWCVPKINHWDYVHFSKHMGSSSQVRSRSKRPGGAHTNRPNQCSNPVFGEPRNDISFC